MLSSRGLALLIPVSLVLGCAGNRSAASSRGCALAAGDSVHLARGPVFPACAVNARAELLNRDVRIDYNQPDRTAPSQRCYSASIRLVVDTSGRPETGTSQLVETNDPAFGAAVLASVPQWRYRPARKAGTSVRQVVLERMQRATLVVVVRQGDARPPLPARRPSC